MTSQRDSEAGVNVTIERGQTPVDAHAVSEDVN